MAAANAQATTGFRCQARVESFPTVRQRFFIDSFRVLRESGRTSCPGRYDDSQSLESWAFECCSPFAPRQDGVHPVSQQGGRMSGLIVRLRKGAVVTATQGRSCCWSGEEIRYEMESIHGY